MYLRIIGFQWLVMLGIFCGRITVAYAGFGDVQGVYYVPSLSEFSTKGLGYGNGRLWVSHGNDAYTVTSHDISSLNFEELSRIEITPTGGSGFFSGYLGLAFTANGHSFYTINTNLRASCDGYLQEIIQISSLSSTAGLTLGELVCPLLNTVPAYTALDPQTQRLFYSDLGNASLDRRPGLLYVDLDSDDTTHYELPLNRSLEACNRNGESCAQMQIRGMAWSGCYLWLINSDGAIHLIDVDDLSEAGPQGRNSLAQVAVMDSRGVPVKLQSIAWDGQSLWVSDNTLKNGNIVIYRVDPGDVNEACINGDRDEDEPEEDCPIEICVDPNPPTLNPTPNDPPMSDPTISVTEDSPSPDNTPLNPSDDSSIPDDPIDTNNECRSTGSWVFWCLLGFVLVLIRKQDDDQSLTH